jgi:hypothetical protein
LLGYPCLRLTFSSIRMVLDFARSNTMLLTDGTI